MADPSAAFSRGNVMREIRELKDRVKELETARTLEAASIGRGGLRVIDGFIVILDAQGNEQMRLSTDGLTLEGLLRVVGRIIVESEDGIEVLGGGSVDVNDGGAIRARYGDGSTAVLYGSLIDINGDPSGHGLVVLDGQSNIFRAKRDESGEHQVYVGGSTDAGPVPVDEFATRSLLTRIRSYDSAENAFFSTFNGGSASINGNDGGDAVLIVDTAGGAPRLVNDNFEVFTAYEGDSGVSANCHLTSEGQILRTSSSSRFKDDIRDAEIDSTTVLRMQPRTWLPSTNVNGYAGAPVEKRMRDRPEDRSSQQKPARRLRTRPQTRQVGFVAEELDDIGLGQFVEHDENGEPGNIAYDRLTAALVTLCQQQQQDIDLLKQRVDALSASTDR